MKTDQPTGPLDPKPNPPAAGIAAPVPAACLTPTTTPPSAPDAQWPTGQPLDLPEERLPIPSTSANPNPIQIDTALGQVVLLSEADQLRLMTLEYSIDESVSQGWKSFVEIGRALMEIKRDELYAAEFATFQEYCRVKWDFGHSKTSYLIAAARIANSIAAIPGLPKPESESPLRPLFKLTPEDAQRAWKLAAEKTGGRRITARVVRNAVQELGLGAELALERSPQSNRLQRQRLIRQCFGELLQLVSRRADPSAVMDKIQELHGLVEGLFSKQHKSSPP